MIYSRNKHRQHTTQYMHIYIREVILFIIVSIPAFLIKEK